MHAATERGGADVIIVYHQARPVITAASRKTFCVGIILQQARPCVRVPRCGFNTIYDLLRVRSLVRTPKGLGGPLAALALNALSE